MKNVIGQALTKIKNEHIKPEPRWKFLLREYAVWVLFILAILLGAISLAVSYDMLIQLDWDLYRFVKQSSLTYTLSLLPYLWLILLGTFLAVSFFDLRKTESGYKYSWPKMVLIAVGSLILLGIIFSVLGLGGKFNAKVATSVPFYGQHMMATKETQWMKPEGGLLAGTIISVLENKISLKDLNGKNWQIILDDKTFIRPRAKIAQVEMIKIIGVQIGENNFQATEVRPWMGMGMMNGQSQNQNSQMMNGRGNGMAR